MSGRRLTGRDYKRTRHSAFPWDLSRLRDLAIGFGVGVCGAGLVYIAIQRNSEPPAQGPRPTPRHTASTEGGNSDPAAAEAALNRLPPGTDGKYDFYTMLPKFEVVVPEKERGTRVAPTAQVDRPGIYFVQVGSYREEDVANRVHAQLTKLGIDSTVQRIAVDSDVWHRVRVGPIKDLPRLNRLREQLRAADLDSLLIRVDE